MSSETDYSIIQWSSSFGASEKKSIENYLLSKGLTNKNTVFFSDVFVDLKKKKLWELGNTKQKEEEQLIVVSCYRVYVFSSTSGKMISDGHLLDLVEFISAKESTPSSKESTPSSKESTTSSKELTLKFRQYTIQYSSEVPKKIKDLELAIQKMYTFNFPGMQEGQLNKEHGPCAGFSRTYKCVSDYYGIPVRDDICWEIDNLFEVNNVKDLNLSDWPDPPTPAQGKAMIEALKYNSWFESIVVYSNPGCKISNDGILSLNNILQTNKTITKLILQGISARESWLTPETWMTMAMNNHIHTIDLSNNSIEDRGTLGLCNDWLATIGHEIVSLNLSKCSIGKAGLSLLFKTIRQNKWILKNIKFLSISGNKIEDSGTDLVPLLAEAVSLRHFEMSDCSVKWSSLRPPQSIQKSKETRNITRLDISNNRIGLEKTSKLASISTQQQQQLQAQQQHQDAQDIASFLQMITPNLADVNLSSTSFPPNAIIPVLSSAFNLMRLDLSDNELGEEGIIQLVEALCQTTLPKLKHLYINRNIILTPSTDLISQTLSQTLSLAGRVVNAARSTASNVANATSTNSASNAIRALVQLISPASFSLCPLETLHVAGASNGRLKGEIIPLAQALLKNNTITELDITGHHAGDELAITLGRVIQANRTLKTLYWDENLTTTVGLEYFSGGFRRNVSIQHMPLPVLDIGELLKLPENSPAMQLIKDRLKLSDNSVTVQQRVTQLASEIQAQIINNNLRKMKNAINSAMTRKRNEAAIASTMKSPNTPNTPSIGGSGSSGNSSQPQTSPTSPSKPTDDQLVEETL